MKSRQVDVKLALDFVWKLRDKLRAEGDKLRAEGNKLWAEGDKLWAEAIIELIGNVTIQWTETGCVVDDDLIFTNI